MTNHDQIIKEMFKSDGDLTDKQLKILVAATEMFAEKGFSATSTNEIAKRAGVAEGTIFRHYKTKKELLLSIVSPVMVKMIGPLIIKDLNKVLNRDFDTFEDFLMAMIKNRQDYLVKNMKIIRILIQEIPFHDELRNQFIEHVGTKVFSRLVEIIEHYKAKGQIHDIPTPTVIRLVGSTVLGLFATKYIISENSDLEDQKEIELTIQFLMKGLAAEK